MAAMFRHSVSATPISCSVIVITLVAVRRRGPMTTALVIWVIKPVILIADVASSWLLVLLTTSRILHVWVPISLIRLLDMALSSATVAVVLIIMIIVIFAPIIFRVVRDVELVVWCVVLSLIRPFLPVRLRIAPVVRENGSLGELIVLISLHIELRVVLLVILAAHLPVILVWLSRISSVIIYGCVSLILGDLLTVFFLVVAGIVFRGDLVSLLLIALVRTTSVIYINVIWIYKFLIVLIVLLGSSCIPPLLFNSLDDWVNIYFFIALVHSVTRAASPSFYVNLLAIIIFLGLVLVSK